MERLLVLKLEAAGCDAEAWLNGIAVARVDASRPRSSLPVHEYTLAGENRLELVLFPRPASESPELAPAPLALVSDGHQSASLSILLPRMGNAADEASSRSLAQLDWAPGAGSTFTAPLRLTQDLSLPISFPRWRWCDAPQLLPPATPVPPALKALALAFVTGLAQDLSRGQTDSFMNATRLRTEELAQAYQRDAETERTRLRDALLEGYAAQGLQWPAPEAAGFALRPLVGGRLLEALGPDGTPALQSAPSTDGQRWALPLRLTVVEGKIYVLR
jgi:hypothetical protein